MSSLRRTISAGVSTGVAVIALSLIASAPAASGRSTHARPFLTDGGTNVIQTVDRGRALFDRHTDSSIRSTSTVQLSASGFQAMKGGLARVVVETDRPSRVAQDVTSLGGRVERSWRNLIQVAIPRGKLSALSARPAVDAVRAPYSRVEHAVSGEEIAASLAPAWNDKGYTGKGVKVAVIDGGFKGLPELQAAGELPTNAITQDFCGGKLATESEHGAAVAEIVHEMAPDAQLYLICVGSEVDLAAAEGYAKSQGVQIINQSMGWEGPYRNDGSGPVGSIVADARANGILWVNSAGNEAVTHWSGTYNPVEDIHVWDPNGDMGNSFIWPNGEEVCGFLKWDEWPAGISDFDLGLFLSGSNTLVGLSAEDQSGSEPPFEAVCMAQNSGRDVVAFWAIRGYRVTTSPRLDLVSWSPPLQYSVAAGSIGTPASSPAVMAVGAVCVQSRQLEFYSSQGPTIDGRTKPEIVGHDSVSGMTYSPSSGCVSGFAGTSASSPEVAGTAALVKQAYPKYGPAEVQQYLMRSAQDLGTPGVDNETGAGELTLPHPPDVTPPTATALPSTGRAGRTIRLVSRVEDDSGEVRITAQVKRNGRTIANLRRAFAHASGATTLALTWKAPADAKGNYQHCVRAYDRAGNASAPSCAKIVLK